MSRLTMAIGAVLLNWGLIVGLTDPSTARAVLPLTVGVVLVGAGASARWGRHRHRMITVAVSGACLGVIAAAITNRPFTLFLLLAYLAVWIYWTTRLRRRRIRRRA